MLSLFRPLFKRNSVRNHFAFLGPLLFLFSMPSCAKIAAVLLSPGAIQPFVNGVGADPRTLLFCVYPAGDFVRRPKLFQSSNNFRAKFRILFNLHALIFTVQSFNTRFFFLLMTRF